MSINLYLPELELVATDRQTNRIHKLISTMLKSVKTQFPMIFKFKKN